MTAIASFIKNPKNVCYDGEDENEQILYIIRRSHLTNIAWSLGIVVMFVTPPLLGLFMPEIVQNIRAIIGTDFLFLLTISWYVFVFGLTLFQYANWFFNVYIISTKKIIDFDFYGLTYKNVSDTLISNVQDVTAKISGPLGTIFNVGHVYVQTAAEKREFDFDNIDDPGKVRDLISDFAAEVKGENNGR